MKLNPNIHKNLVRICKRFDVSLKNSKGDYEEVSKIQERLKQRIGY